MAPAMSWVRECLIWELCLLYDFSGGFIFFL